MSYHYKIIEIRPEMQKITLNGSFIISLNRLLRKLNQKMQQNDKSAATSDLWLTAEIKDLNAEGRKGSLIRRQL